MAALMHAALPVPLPLAQALPPAQAPPLALLLPAELNATRLATGWAIFQGLLIEALPFLLLGVVIAAAARWLAPDGRWLCIASLQTQAAESGVLHVGSSDGPALQLLALPYPLLEDI